MTTTTATITYRKTKTGEWVAYGPAASMPTVGSAITVSKKDGSTKVETIARKGNPFTVDGVEMVYAYLAPRSADTFHGRRCISDGNCSSFGSGRSCGGSDCDGY